MGKSEKINNFIAGVFCLIVAIICFIIVIAVAVSGIMNNERISENYIQYIRQGEQAMCKRSDVSDDDVIFRYEKDGYGYIDAYKIKKTAAHVSTHTHWDQRTASIKSNHWWRLFTVNSPLEADVEFTVTLSQSASSNDLKFWLLTGDEYDKAYYSGNFHTDYYLPYKSSWSSGNNTIRLYGKPNTFYNFVFYSYYGITFDYEVDIDYTVYSVANGEKVDCKKSGKYYECKTELDDDEIFVANFPETTSSAAPGSIFAVFFVKDINWSAIIGGVAFVGLVGIFFLICALVLMYKGLKKMGKIGKKAIKKMEKNNETQMQTVQAAPAPAPAAYPADPNYGAQPYPAQPYPAQPYPGQAYPAQPYPAQ